MKHITEIKLENSKMRALMALREIRANSVSLDFETADNELVVIIGHEVKLDNFEVIESVSSRLFSLCNGLTTDENADYAYLKPILKSHISGIYNEIVEQRSKEKGVNSKEYYEKQIDVFKEREEALKQQLESVKSESDSDKAKRKELESQLKHVNEDKQKMEKLLEERKKNDAAQKDWNKKIKKAFEKLKFYLEPIKKERCRLNVLYWVYAILSAVALLAVIVIECRAIKGLNITDGFPSFEEYLILFTPLPVAGFLMWGFISQMNRAQRQLMVIAHKIHSIDYIQGLLLAINKLSPDINETIPRINKAIDKIISNHLDSESLYSEEEIQQEEHKDQSMDLDRLIKLLKAVKEGAS